MPITLMSGGQTGVDRAALDLALERGWPCRGWCPKGRRAEDGPLPARYPLTETPLPFYPQRTERNVRDSDGTLILYSGAPRGGTALTIRLVKRHRRPLLKVDLDRPPIPALVRDWIATERVRVLNVAGPRESEAPGIYRRAIEFLAAALRDLDD